MLTESQVKTLRTARRFEPEKEKSAPCPAAKTPYLAP
jgi:hypothetical protein